jgi:hypothetical protein
MPIRAAAFVIVCLCAVGCVSTAADPTERSTLVPRGTFALLPRPTPTSLPLDTPTPAPRVLSLSVESLDTVIRLHWPLIPGAQGYVIFRDAAVRPLNPSPVTTTTYDDIGLTNGRSYRYSVTVIGPDGQTLMRSAGVSAAPRPK